ncbi:lactate racemase domain-containing protein [Pseudoflavonifractor sp. MSJ-37]|uniref:lactate racemase domain-containing protein n=1 Tax=Pseudoflavonifractor sp. MSJ-37 TaxID=2841531 RepID=UPI001C107B9B|nr:lactate racemase domain-containing protein [Pseudoflavonifractor sp. MSJ-37]MBU5434014.1 nickel-dependent lactate racemase [Pseudoflavonifractor sp. MSJ-37]
MAFESDKNSVPMQLCQTVTLPKMVKVHQKFDTTHIDPKDLPGVVHAQLERENVRKNIKPGMSIAVTCGSRGIANIAIIVRAIVDFVKECGAEPFVFPAMGSHGGATPEGQLEVLESYGVTEETMGCPLRATMETVQLGTTVEGSPVFIDKYAHEADGVILCGRIKAHTSFRGPYESGLLKMSVIGMGKQHGAESVHESGFQNMGRVMPQFARVIFDHTNIVAGVGIIENAYDQTYKIAALDAKEIWEQEPELLKEANSKMGRLWIEKADVLVVDKLGKNISGDGMDPNVSGTFGSPGRQRNEVPGPIDAQRCVVLDLTDESHGNFNGIGVADVTTKRLIDKAVPDVTYPNAMTSTLVNMVKMPIFGHSDERAIQLAVRVCNGIDKDHAKIVRIKNTMEIRDIWVSEALIDEVKANPNLELMGEPEPWGFDENGNLW